MRTPLHTAVGGAELLEEVRNRLHCAYLSDLRFSPMKTQAIRCLANMDGCRYSLWEWNDAIAYLLEENTVCGDILTAQDRFRQAAQRMLPAAGHMLVTATVQ
ncbi:MAG: hypothetical protein VB087_01365 [Candidatus Limiplasma sp.]|nr:hypothetical protein [Candidatus Limiplasma sp.]